MRNLISSQDRSLCANERCLKEKREILSRKGRENGEKNYGKYNDSAGNFHFMQHFGNTLFIYFTCPSTIRTDNVFFRTFTLPGSALFTVVIFSNLNTKRSVIFS